MSANVQNIPLNKKRNINQQNSNCVITFKIKYFC